MFNKDVKTQLRIKLKSNERHTILKTHLDETTWKKTKKHFKNLVFKNKETYGFFFVKQETLTKKSLRKTLWTPKSKKILKKLDL